MWLRGASNALFAGLIIVAGGLQVENPTNGTLGTHKFVEHHMQRAREVQHAVAQQLITSDTLATSEVLNSIRQYYLDPQQAAIVGAVLPEGSSPAFLVKTAALLLCILGIMYCYSQVHESVEKQTGFKLAHVCCIAYATLSISIDLCIKNASVAYGGHFPFHPACGVIVIEYTKSAVSMVLFAYTVRKASVDGKPIVWPRIEAIAWLVVPAAIYAASNILVFKAIQSCPLATFSVLRETMIIWNAVIWSWTFTHSISASRWIAIGGICLGCSINEVPRMLHDEWTSGVLWALMLAFCNGAGAVANEYAMKQRAQVDINLQNVIVYSLCGSFVLVGLAFTSPKHVRSVEVFFTGFVPECWQIIILQAFTGLAVSRILKYIEAVTKTIVAALRGPGVILVGAVIFRFRLGVPDVLASLIVCASCWWYLRMGPIRSVRQTSKLTKGTATERTPLQQPTASARLNTRPLMAAVEHDLEIEFVLISGEPLPVQVSIGENVRRAKRRLEETQPITPGYICVGTKLLHNGVVLRDSEVMDSFAGERVQVVFSGVEVPEGVWNTSYRFPIGTYAVITDNTKAYTTYTQAAEQLGLKRWQSQKRRQLPNGSEVIVIGSLPEGSIGLAIIAIQDADEVQYLVRSDGLEVV